VLMIAEVFEVGMVGVATPIPRARYSSNPMSAKAYNRKRKANTADRPSEIAPCSVINPVQMLEGPVDRPEVRTVQQQFDHGLLRRGGLGGPLQVGNLLLEELLPDDQLLGLPLDLAAILDIIAEHQRVALADAPAF